MGRLCVPGKSTRSSVLCHIIYPDSNTQIQKWLVAPFKDPEARHPDKTYFNNRLSQLRVRNEHANGLLKGRFQSLRGLRLNISDEKTHKFATYWCVCCIHLHNFALAREAEEREAAGDDMDPADDPFVAAGLSSSSEEEDDDMELEDLYPRSARWRTGLLQGRQFRLKKMNELLRARERQADRRRRRTRIARQDILGDIDDEDYEADDE